MMHHHRIHLTFFQVLDELNLAPSEVLEMLNRLLDDNRELMIPDTQEVIKPHADFAVFATQNPTGVYVASPLIYNRFCALNNAAGRYGGRKELSRAFRSRFLEITTINLQHQNRKPPASKP